MESLEIQNQDFHLSPVLGNRQRDSHIPTGATTALIITKELKTATRKLLPMFPAGHLNCLLLRHNLCLGRFRLPHTEDLADAAHPDG